MSSALPLVVGIPLLAAFLLPIVGKLRRGEALADAVAVLISAAILVLAGMLLADGSNFTYWAGGWGKTLESPVGISMSVDGLTRLLLLTVAIVAFAATLFSIPYMRNYTSRPLYFSLFFLMVAGMNGLVISSDLFNMYVFLEIASIASYALVAFGCESEELEASFRYLIISAIASTFVLFGIGILYNASGVLNAGQVAEFVAANPGHLGVLVALSFFFTGYAVKAAMVPFHAWLPDAHPSAPAPVSAMLSGVLIKAIGLYALFRLIFNIFGANLNVSYLLMAGGVISMLAGVLLAVGQWDLKRLLAYHSVSQMGYVLLGIGIGAQMVVLQGPLSPVAALAFFGGLFHLFNHAFFKSLLFLSAGSIERATGTRNLKEMGGLAEKMPWTASCLRIGALSISGIPPFNGFWSKLIIVIAAVWSGHYLLAALTVLVSFLTLVSFIKVQKYCLQGPVPQTMSHVTESPALMGLAMGILALGCVVMGVFVLVPALSRAVFEPAVHSLSSGVSEYVQLVLGGRR